MNDALEATQQPPKVLIADDDPGIARLLASRCAKMGFEVQTAGNGLHALVMAGRYHPDVLIVDINMPEVDGLSVCMRLLDPNERPMDVIVITASSYSDTVERCESFGAHYVRKGRDLWDGVRAALLERFPQMADAVVEEKTAPPRLEWTRPRILLVDGDADVGAFLTSRLRKFGVDTLIAHDAIQGYTVACREEPSVIITDYLLPSGDALYLLSRLRSTPVTQSIPVFVMTTNSLDERTRSLLTRDVRGWPGALRFFQKSFDTQELFLAIQKYCAFTAQGGTSLDLEHQR